LQNKINFLETEKGNSDCLNDTLTVLKNFLDRNDRKSLIDNVNLLNKKYSLENVFGTSVQQIKELNENNNYGKSVEQMINEKYKMKRNNV